MCRSRGHSRDRDAMGADLKPDVEPEISKRRGLHGLLTSFRYAFDGIACLFRTQRNARIELAIGIAACIVAGWLRISRTEWCVLTLTIACVLILEGLNTAIEAAVDLASPQIQAAGQAAAQRSRGRDGAHRQYLQSVVVGLPDSRATALA